MCVYQYSGCLTLPHFPTLLQPFTSSLIKEKKIQQLFVLSQRHVSIIVLFLFYFLLFNHSLASLIILLPLLYFLAHWFILFLPFCFTALFHSVFYIYSIICVFSLGFNSTLLTFALQNLLSFALLHSLSYPSSILPLCALPLSILPRFALLLFYSSPFFYPSLIFFSLFYLFYILQLFALPLFYSCTLCSTSLKFFYSLHYISSILPLFALTLFHSSTLCSIFLPFFHSLLYLSSIFNSCSTSLPFFYSLLYLSSIL